MKFPISVKVTFFLISMFLFLSILDIAQAILLPLIYAMIITILLGPAVRFLVIRRFNRAIAVGLVLICTIAIAFILVSLLSTQIGRFSDAVPMLSAKFTEFLEESIKSFSSYFNIREAKVNDWIANLKSEATANSTRMIGTTLSAVSGLLSTVFLTPVYVFMLLFYQPHLILFLNKLFGESNGSNISGLLANTKSIIQNYLLGLFIEFIIVAILNTCGLLLLGIDYALLLGLLGALLNIIPYLGGMLAMLMFMLVALVTKDPIYMLYVIMLYATIQLIDNNYIVPRIVGSKVKLNALTSLLTVILGAALWGIPGMFLSIPVTAIVKLLLDHSPGLQPWGFLLGDTTVVQPVLEVKKSVSDEAHPSPALSASLKLKRRRPFKEFLPPK